VKYIFLLFIFFISSAIAEDDCVFDVDAQKEIVQEYIQKNKDAQPGQTDIDIVLSRGNESINISRGGCDHFEISVVSISNRQYSEQDFFDKSIVLIEEFSKEIVDIELLKEAISNKNWEEFEGRYFINIDMATVVVLSYSAEGRVHVTASFQ